MENNKRWRVETAGPKDRDGLLSLYTQLHDNPIPQAGPALDAVWEEILADRHQEILILREGGQIVSSCVLVIVPNLTHGQRPYAVVENVVTARDFRKRGCASAVLAEAKRRAEAAGCYKIMLMTGSRQEATLRFYERAGYNRTDKTAFVQWL